MTKDQRFFTADRLSEGSCIPHSLDFSRMRMMREMRSSECETLAQRYERVAAKQRETLVVSADDFRVDDNGIYHHDGDLGVIAWRMAERVFTELLPTVDRVVALVGAPGAGKSTWVTTHGDVGVLYLDTTLSRRRRRRDVCAMARDAGQEISCMFLHPELEVCLARNRSRGRQVPDNIIRRAHHRLSVCPPSEEEGWASVTVVGVSSSHTAAL